MGNVCNRKQRSIRATVSLIGLDNSGKTTLLSAIKGCVDPDPMPTVGFSSHEVKHGKSSIMTYYDLGGGSKIRGIWPWYYASVYGVIFVIDSTDRTRMDEVRQTLQNVGQDAHMIGKHVLIFANKQDVAECMSVDEIQGALDLDALSSRLEVKLFPCVAKSVLGKPTDRHIIDGLKWLGDALREGYDDIHNRVTRNREEEKRKKDEERRRKRKEIQERKEREAAEAETGPEEFQVLEEFEEAQEEQSKAQDPTGKETEVDQELQEPGVDNLSSQMEKEKKEKKPTHVRHKRNQVIPLGDQDSESEDRQ